MIIARRLVARFLSAFALAFVGVAATAALPPGVTQGPSIEGITQYTLANGLTVLLFPDASAAKTTVNLTYLVGSRQENYGETGMAHLLEHMLFKGTPTIANPKEELTKRGMRFNASTWYDRTNYHETFNASPADLQWALAMEADRMINAKVARADLDSEMTVVRNEMEMGENNPWNMLIQRLTGTAYDWHNYGKDTIGARSDVEGVDIGRLQAYLPHVLPARQRGAGRCRSLRSGRDAGLDREELRRDRETRAGAAAALYRRAGTGRRAQRRDPPRR